MGFHVYVYLFDICGFREQLRLPIIALLVHEAGLLGLVNIRHLQERLSDRALSRVRLTYKALSNLTWDTLASGKTVVAGCSDCLVEF